MICFFILEREFYFVGTVSISICYLKVVAEVHLFIFIMNIGAVERLMNEHWSWGVWGVMVKPLKEACPCIIPG